VGRVCAITTRSAVTLFLAWTVAWADNLKACIDEQELCSLLLWRDNTVTRSCPQSKPVSICHSQEQKSQNCHSCCNVRAVWPTGNERNYVVFNNLIIFLSCEF
jgi:hypothetical protein